jgi:hypothetical protein
LDATFDIWSLLFVGICLLDGWIDGNSSLMRLGRWQAVPAMTPLPLWHGSPLGAMVDVHVFSCTEGVMKPDRRIFEVATTRLGVEANECIYIGDGADDELEGAQAVGMDAILLRPGDTSPPQRLSGPELASLSQVLTVLDSEP